MISRLLLLSSASTLMDLPILLTFYQSTDGCESICRYLPLKQIPPYPISEASVSTILGTNGSPIYNNECYRSEHTSFFNNSSKLWIRFCISEGATILWYPNCSQKFPNSCLVLDKHGVTLSCKCSTTEDGGKLELRKVVSKIIISRHFNRKGMKERVLYVGTKGRWYQGLA